ncbi:hypothetical protein LTR53_001168 [Teratosphaeriaceae sp. CCFEE 6253]|nr:hypothetical protein LTR53_001168 [Teratosphaeriaceae sp. CCFEE 6253]
MQRSNRIVPGPQPRLKIVQHSPLLDLPAELRVLVYEYAATEPADIHCKHQFVSRGGIAYDSAMSKTCRQIRTEYKDPYLRQASHHATSINFHVTNFDYNTFSSCHVYYTIHRLQNLASANYTHLDAPHYDPKTFRMHVRLTNVFDHDLAPLRKACHGIEYGFQWEPETYTRLAFEYRITLDHKSFDLIYAKQVFRRLDRGYVETEPVPDEEYEWWKIKTAFARAAERCEAEAAERLRRRAARKGGSRKTKAKTALSRQSKKGAVRN